MGKEKMIEVPADVFLELAETQARVNALIGFTNRSKFMIQREDIANFLGFELESHDGEKEPEVL